MESFDDLASLWQSQPPAVRAADAGLRTRLRRQEARERAIGSLKITAVVVAIVPFAWWVLVAWRSAPFTAAGAAWCAASAALLVAAEWRQQRASTIDLAVPSAEFVGTAIATLQRRHRDVLRHARLLSVSLAAGLNLMAWGMTGPRPASRLAIHALAVFMPLAGYAAGRALRRRRTDAALEALLAHLRSVERDVHDPSDSDGPGR